MDRPRITQVLRRHKVLVAIGLVVGVGLAVLTFLRSEPQIQSDSIIFVTQEGSPWFRVDPVVGDPNASFDSERFVEAAALYASFGDTDIVKSRVKEAGEITGEVETSLVQPDSSRGPLPLIRISAIDSSPERAVDLANRWTAALTTIIRDRQKAQNLPRDQVILLEQIQRPQVDEAEVVKPRSPTRPIAILLGVVVVFGGLIFGLDGSQRRREEDPKTESESGDDQHPEASSGGETAGEDPLPRAESTASPVLVPGSDDPRELPY